MAFHFFSGIRKKITVTFYLLLVFTIGTAVLKYGIVNEAKRKVAYVEIIDDLLNTTLEIRRFEKNYFLYKEEGNYRENEAFVEKLVRLLFQNAQLLNSLMTRRTYKEIWNTVRDYKQNMQDLHTNYQEAYPDLVAERLRLEEAIRSQGKRLTDIAEQTSREQRQAIKSLLHTTSQVLLISMLVFVVLCIVMAAFLGRNIVNSLKILETHTKRISQGELVAAPLNVGDSEIRSLLQAFNRMTTELKVRQHQLVQSEKLASLGTLLSGVAHELNNPLSNISTSAQILSEELDDADREFIDSLIKQIIDQADRGRDIVRTLLEFSRIRSFHKEELLLKPLIDETIVLVRGQVPSEVNIQVDIPADLKIMADKQRLQQVFLNLIKNAIDVLGKEGHIWIYAQEVRTERGRREIELLIEDDGPGIPPENLSRIFDPFFTTKDVGHGSGLGLYVVHDIIEWHGGTIRVDSRPGEGTTFVIWLPGSQGGKNGRHTASAGR
jgi:two-component system NtrC family sensor kinase